MAKVFTVYVATCLANGKAYVGFDSCWPARKRFHKRDAGGGAKGMFHRAIRKHGWESFEWEALYQSLDGEHCLKVMEPHFIAERDSFRSGYNMTLGGEGGLGHRHSAESRAKMSAALRGKSFSPEHRANIGKARRARPLPEEVTSRMIAARTGVALSAETRAKMSAARAGKKFSPGHRAAISASKANHKHSPETRAKIAAAMTGKKATAETRARMSASAKRATASPRRAGP